MPSPLNPSTGKMTNWSMSPEGSLGGAGQPSNQINNPIYQSDQSIQIRYRILSDQSTQIQASIHLIYLIFLAQRGATLELPDHPFVPAPQTPSFVITLSWHTN